MREMVGGCCVCSDDRGWSENPLVYCDGQSCTVAVHQACYGIVTVPTGPWYCRKCESQERSVKVKCELCPSKYGALKRTDNQGWAHVVCALYIPEVRFGNVTTMEPIQLQLIPAERFSKVCYICEEKGKPANASVGACMQCNKAGCRQQFHVTCAQGLGLLCEEAGNYLDNVKYCGYCQHHYSKLKKGGNVKTIPPYKPVANEAHNSDSSSEKEGTPSKAANPSPPTAASKKKTTANAKTVPSKSSNKSQSKPVNNNAKNAEKGKATNAKSGKTEELEKNGDSEPKESRDTKGAKKRKANSRAPTPVGVAGSEVSVVVNPVTSAGLVAGGGNSNLNSVGDKGGVAGSESAVDKKKAKIETTQSIITNQPVVALTSISAPKPSSAPLPSAPADPTATPPEPVSIPPAPPLPLPPTIIQTTQAQSHSQSQLQAQAHSLVVSVPLVNASLSPLGPIVCNQTSVVTATPSASERSGSVGCSEKSASVISSEVMTGGNSNQGLLTSDMNTGGLKITYEKQMDSINTEVDMELELEPSPSRTVEVPAKRGRSQSQSNEKTDRSSRSRKRNGSSATCPAPSSIVETHTKRASRSQHVTPPPMPLPLAGSEPPGAFAAISQAQMKESPPSSPSSESQSNPPSTRGRTRGRKSAPAAVNVGSGSSKDSKDVKIFQNGMSAPHMLGNQLNPNSTMHSKMNDHLNNEIEAHSIFSANDQLGTSLTGPQLHHKVLQQARASSTSSSTTSGGSGLSSMLGGGGGTIPQTLDQLLERQWEQGSQFLMEQAQHFDIASLLSCLHQLRAENLRLEEHVSSLLQRRDHLLAVNARLAIPLTNQPAAAPISTHPHQINNVHPSVAASHADATRSARHNGSTAPYPSHPQGTSAQHAAPENGLPPDPYGQSHPHRSPAGSQQSPNVRLSPAPGTFPTSDLHRQNADACRPRPYLSYERHGPSASSHQQMVIRRDRNDDRDSDRHHLGSTKPS